MKYIRLTVRREDGGKEWRSVEKILSPMKILIVFSSDVP